MGNKREGGSSGFNELYRNEGGGIFTAVISSPITSSNVWTSSVAWGDMDGDGDLVRRCSPKALLCFF